MSRTELLDNNYNFEQKRPKGSVILILRLSLAVIFVALSAQVSAFAYASDSVDKIHSSSQVVIIIFAAIMLIYFALKVGIITMCCQYKKDAIATFKVLETGGISIFTCREALKGWQLVLIHSLPSILAYTVLCVMIAIWTFESVFMFFLFLSSIFLACDFTVAAYIIYIKITYRPDYIAINHHIYNLTLYKKMLDKV